MCFIIFFYYLLHRVLVDAENIDIWNGNNKSDLLSLENISRLNNLLDDLKNLNMDYTILRLDNYNNCGELQLYGIEV